MARTRDEKGETALEYIVVQRTTAPDHQLEGPNSVSDAVVRELKLQFGSRIDVYLVPAGHRHRRLMELGRLLVQLGSR